MIAFSPLGTTRGAGSEVLSVDVDSGSGDGDR